MVLDDAGGVGLFERRLLGKPFPLLLVELETLRGEWACDGGVRRAVVADNF